MAKYPAHDHEFSEVTHQTQSPNKNTGEVREFITWSQCGICGESEGKRPKDAPPVKATTYKGDPPA